MKPSSRLRRFLAIAGSAVLTMSYAHAVDGTWISTTAGPFNWSNGPSWTSGTVADGVDSTASFTANITANQVVNLDSARTIGNITFTDSTTASNDLTISGANILTLDRTSGIPTINVTNRTLTISSQISGNDGLQKNGAGSLVLSSASNTFSGGITLNGGTLSFGANTHLGDAANAISVTGNSTLAWTGGATTQARAIDIASGSTLSISGVSSSGYSRALTGSGTLTNAGSSQPYIFSSTNNTFTGTVNAAYGMTFASLGDGGTYNFGNSSVGLTWTGGAQTFASRVFTMNAAGSAPIVNNGSGALIIEQNLAISGTAGARTLSLSGSNTTSTNRFVGNIADGVGSVVGLTKGGDNSRWALSGTNTYTGATTLAPGGSTADAGLLIFQGIQALSSSTSLNIAQGGSNQRWGTIRILDDSATPASRSGVNLNFSNTEAVGTGDLRHWMRVFVGNNSTANLGTSASTQTGSTIQLGNLNISEGATASTGGGLWVSGANGYRLQIANVNVTLQAGTAGNHVATLRADNPMTVTGTVRQANDATAGSNTTLALEGSATSSLISGAIRNSTGGRLMNLSKAGTGTWSLSGTNDYTGTTAISAGILRITGDSSAATGAVSVTAGALGGNGGTLGGAVTVSATGGIDLRDGSVGTLTLGNTLGITGAAGANNLRFDMGNGTGTSDSLSVAGDTTVTNAGAAVIDLRWLGGASGRTATTYTLIGGAGTLDSTNAGKFSLPITKAFGQTYTLQHNTANNGDLDLVVANVTAATPAAFWAGSTSVNWSAAGNWRDTLAGGGAVAGAPDYQTNVTFSTTTPTPGNLLTNVLDTDFNINSLTFTNASGNVTIAGPGALTLEAAAVNGNTVGNGINSLKTSGTNTISARVALASSQTWTVASGGTLAVSGVISDFGLGYGITKAGAGSLELNASNTFSGNVNIAAGTIRMSTDVNDTRLFGAAGNTITFTGNSTIRTVADGTYDLPQNITINNGVTGTIQGAFGESVNASGVISGTGSLTIQGDSNGFVTTLSNTANTFTGAISINPNSTTTLSVASLGSSVTNAITMNGAGNNPVFTYTGSAALSRPFVIATTTGGVGINSSGSGALTASGFSVTGAGAKTITLGGGSAASNTIDGNIVNNGGNTSLTKNDTGNWSLSGTANTFTGTITVNNGTLAYASAGGANPITFSNTTGGATLSYTGSTDKTMSGAINASTVTSGTVTLGSTGAGAVNYSNTASLGSAGSLNKNLVLTGTNTGNNILAGQWVNNTGGAATLTKSGVGKWVLTNTNSYTGATTISGGTLQLGNGGTTGALTGTASISNSGNLTINRSNAFTQLTDLNNKVISGGGSFSQAGAGTTTLSLVNSYTGATQVTNGTLEITGTGSINSSTSLTISSGATFRYNSSIALTIATITNSGTIAGSGNLGAITLDGSGSVDPGNSPGILTAAATDPAGGLDYNFEFTAVGLPTWNNASASINDVLRLTDATSPFTGNLDVDNMVNIYLNVASLSAGQTYTGGFYTDKGTSFLSSITGADFNYYLLNASSGLVTYNGIKYDLYTGPLGFTVDTLSQTADFGAGNVNGYVSQFTVVPEPNVAALLGGLGTLMLLRRRRN